MEKNNNLYEEYEEILNNFKKNKNNVDSFDKGACFLIAINEHRYYSMIDRLTFNEIYVRPVIQFIEMEENLSYSENETSKNYLVENEEIIRLGLSWGNPENLIPEFSAILKNLFSLGKEQENDKVKVLVKVKN